MRCHGRWFALVFAGGLCWFGGTGATDAMANGAGPSEVNVIAHKSAVIELTEPFTKILVANDKIADVVPLTDQSLSIVGKKDWRNQPDVAWHQQDRDRRDRHQRHAQSERSEQKLRSHLPDSDVRVTEANGRILLSGRVEDARAVETAVSIAEQYAPKNVTNTIDVRQTQQVMLEVRFVEASRRASTELGIGTRTRGSRHQCEFRAAGTGSGGYLEHHVAGFRGGAVRDDDRAAP